MKATGMIRKIDELGRVVLPSEMRKALGIKERDAMEIFVEEDCVILKKYQSDRTCMVTGDVVFRPLKLANGRITLSHAGAKQLLIELRRTME